MESWGHGMMECRGREGFPAVDADGGGTGNIRAALAVRERGVKE